MSTSLSSSLGAHRRKDCLRVHTREQLEILIHLAYRTLHRNLHDDSISNHSRGGSDSILTVPFTKKSRMTALVHAEGAEIDMCFEP